MGKEIALLCRLHPRDQPKRDRVLDLLRRAAREYYRQPAAQCTTWSYATTWPPPRAPSAAAAAVVGLEIYTDKAALTAQLDDTAYFKPYHATTQREDLYARPAELVAGYAAGGFVARGPAAPPSGGVLVSVSLFVCRDRGVVLRTLREFSRWVRDVEPDVLTYAIFTRPKAPTEVMLFVRYKDRKALQGHSQAPEHVAVVKQLSKQLENDAGKATTLWQEVDDSFVAASADGVPKPKARL